LFGIALSKIGEKAKPVLKGIKSAEAGLFAVINIIMKVAPVVHLAQWRSQLGSLCWLPGFIGQLMLSFISHVFSS